MSARWLLVAALAMALPACREKPGSEVGEEDQGGGGGGGGGEVRIGDPDQWIAEVTGNERWLQPPGTARITFYVDDQANGTFADGDMVWTGSWAWSEKTNMITFNAAWGPQDGPYPLLYDDGPISEGGHEMAGATAGDGIFSTEVYFKATEATDFSYGVLNELGYWMWEGPNGLISFPAGSTDTVHAQGLTLPAFGKIDLKLTIDIGKVNPAFAYIEEWDELSLFVKGTMNMWTPSQILDSGPELDKGDEVKGDGIYTFVQGRNLGKHTGLLYDGQHVQFTFVFLKDEGALDSAPEYKLLTEGTQKGAREGVKAWFSCDGGKSWQATEILWEKDSWGSSENTTVVAACDGEPPEPECTKDDDCGAGEKCKEGECKLWCDQDGECGAGEKCVGNKCRHWCDSDEECGSGFECKEHKCVKKETVSKPMIASLEPATGPTEGGTLVTISGSDFLDGATVAFGGKSAIGAMTLSATEIEVVTPGNNAGKADVVVTNPDGGTTTFVKGFLYVEEAAAPTIDSIDPKEGQVTGGTVVSIHGSNFMPGATVLFGAKVAGWVDFVNSTLLKAASPTGALGKVDIVVANPDSQQAALAQAFTYTPNLPDWAGLKTAGPLQGFVGQPGALIYAEVYEAGVTEPKGQGAGVQAEWGYGPAAGALDGWSWFPATYSGDAGNNDLYQAELTGAAAGSYRFAFRFSMDGANWVVADLDGSQNGFEPAAAGQWELAELGAGPAIFGVMPGVLSVLGGETVTISGANFEAGLKLEVGGQEVVPVSTNQQQVTFTAPAHAAGQVSLKLTNPSGGDSVELAAALRYVLKLTVTPDGSLADWSAPFLLATNAVASNWDAEVNRLEKLYVAFDDQQLYIGIAGLVEQSNCILGYVDVDFGGGSGIADMMALSDNGKGDLDDGLSNVLLVLDPAFGADFAFGTKGMVAVAAGSTSADAGWRGLSPLFDLPWLDGPVATSAEGAVVEAAIPLTTLFGGPVPAGGRTVAIFIKLTNSFGGFEGISNQTLPGCYDADAVHEVATVVTLFVAL